ncbi:galactokinase [Neolewinella antarctica]|uniref:Galactokinase n=1 Tax=Neolewinella antarctica TaxID=442734 RepID=A0ABX0XFD4_9BACT|nr:galactokinase [Neolewinella antarctica]NJC28030.1 galactokinase [Neolewinella antarctica]
MSTTLNQVAAALSGPPEYVVRSPGRINVIGEHTDYNGGLVLPAAIDRSIFFAARRIPENDWQLKALDIGQEATLPLPVNRPGARQWVNYLAGIGREFQKLGYTLPGLELSFGGDLPAGAGMSSSAALEGGIAFLLNELVQAGLGRVDLARLTQRSSNEFLGVPSGIMDQFASLNGSPDGPLLLNCTTLDYRVITNKLSDHTFLLVNSLVSHDLANSEYPVRVAQCREALRAIQVNYPDVKSLGATTLDQLMDISDTCSPIAMQRARFVVRENQRVIKMVGALREGNADLAISLLNETHAGLRNAYEVSCPEVDYLQQQATRVFSGSAVGARIMGGGFGGCTINLVRRADAADFIDFIKNAYHREFGRWPDVYPVTLAAGTNFVPVSSTPTGHSG